MHFQALDGANFEVLSTCLELAVDATVFPDLAEELPGAGKKITTLA